MTGKVVKMGFFQSIIHVYIDRMRCKGLNLPKLKTTKNQIKLLDKSYAYG